MGMERIFDFSMSSSNDSEDIPAEAARTLGGMRNKRSPRTPVVQNRGRPARSHQHNHHNKIRNKVSTTPDSKLSRTSTSISQSPSPISYGSVSGSNRSNITFKSNGSNQTKLSAKSAEVGNNRTDKSVSTQMSSQTTKTHAKFNRKSRLPTMLNFRKKTRKKKKSSEEKEDAFSANGRDSRYGRGREQDDGASTSSYTSALSNKSKSALLAEFGTLMNEFPTSDTLNTTLHVACLKHYSDSLIVDQLIAKGPSAVTMRNQNRDLPLHSAMKSKIGCGVDDRVYDALVKVYPEGIEAVNKDNCLPIHLACHAGGRNFHVIKKLIKAYPVSAIMKCDLKLPFDSKSLRYINRSESRPGSAVIYENDDRPEGKEKYDGTCYGTFWNALLNLSPRPSFEAPEAMATSADPGMESEFGPLHLAVMSGAPPDVIELIITTNPRCLGLKTNQGRKAIDIARYAVAGREDERPKTAAMFRKPHFFDEDEEIHNQSIRNIDENPIQNIFAAIEIISTFDDNRRKSLLLANATQMTSASIKDLSTIEEFDPKREWRKLGNMIKFAGALKTPESVLGRQVPLDANESVRPKGYTVPKNLNHVCVEIDLPVGFRRLRWAMLSSDSRFLSTEVLQQKLLYSQVKMDPWNIHDDSIGDREDMDATNFIGAERKCQYLMPRSGMVKANMAYETHSIVDYNDYAFVTRKVTKNPDVPYGTSFECHVQTIFINMGYNNVRMVASVEAKFIGKPPMVAWKIKNAMYNGVTDFFVAKGEIICEHVLREGNDV